MAVSTSPIDAADLARRAADGASDAEDDLCRAFAPRIWAFGIRHLREPNDAADLVQQVLLVVLEALRSGKVRQVDQIGSFVLGTSRRLAIDLRRTRSRRAALVERFGPGTFEGAVVSPEWTDVDRLEECLAQLTHTARRVLVMTFFEDAASQEIADALRVSPGNVRVIRHRALETLRSCVQSNGDARGGQE